jgi:hypothetical protein
MAPTPEALMAAKAMGAVMGTLMLGMLCWALLSRARTGQWCAPWTRMAQPHFSPEPIVPTHLPPAGPPPPPGGRYEYAQGPTPTLQSIPVAK